MAREPWKRLFPLLMAKPTEFGRTQSA
ncbi:hypothetical protein CCACVL1_17078 [Corchorus capsularis]|uniref:Uncharacterized protein n=1 Tax=Corchorus capsularis TaxID=210143 RepID=A0A1R3HU51_COCAP|nr:hypothetical protein CCACVL1_17078 [Corchorus capsularis]